jgi:hypothetical protein
MKGEIRTLIKRELYKIKILLNCGPYEQCLKWHLMYNIEQYQSSIFIGT